MPVKLTERHDGKILEVQASGRLSHEDYRQFVPAFERLTKQHGKINVLFEMVDFHGWEAAALWDDLKFNLTHLSQIERLAMVATRSGSKAWPIFALRSRMPTSDSLTPPNLRMPATGLGFHPCCDS